MAQCKQRSEFDSSSDEEHEVTPLVISWLDLSTYGSYELLGISSLPGCRFQDIWRNLTQDIEMLKASQVKDIFVLCTGGELNKYRVPNLLSRLTDAGLTVHHYPVIDGCVTAPEELRTMLDKIRTNLSQSRKSVVCCYGGLGRSAVVAACLLLMLDATLNPDAAIATLRQLRGNGAIQSVKQYNFLQEFRQLPVVDFSSSPDVNGSDRSRSISR